MKTALKKNHKPAIWISITIIILTLGCSCNSPGPSRNLTPQAEIQPESPTQEAISPDMQPPQSSPAENNNQADCLAGIFPGQTSRAEVIALLGVPIAAEQDGGYEALQYASPVRGQYNTVYLMNQVVNWVSIVLADENPLAWSAVKAQYGEPTHIAYSDYVQGSRNFAFPERGLNFITDDELDIVYIQECFIPMSVGNYIEAYGDFLLQEDPFTK